MANFVYRSKYYIQHAYFKQHVISAQINVNHSRLGGFFLSNNVSGTYTDYTAYKFSNSYLRFLNVIVTELHATFFEARFVYCRD